MFAMENYHRATDLNDAVRALAAHPEARVLAGGTDVLIRLREGDGSFAHLVDINGLDELRQIDMDTSGTIRIGSLATCTRIIEHEIIRSHLPVIAASLATIGGPQIRNIATMGGNICNGAVSADSACALLILDTELVIQGPAGERTVPILGFHTGPGRTILRRDEILKYFLFRPGQYRGIGAAYCKYAMRSAMDIATIGCGAALRMEGDIITSLKLAFTVAAPTPVRCPRTEEAAAGRRLDEETLALLARTVEDDVRPRTSWRAERDFRMHIIRTLVQRVTREAANQQGGN